MGMHAGHCCVPVATAFVFAHTAFAFAHTAFALLTLPLRLLTLPEATAGTPSLSTRHTSTFAEAHPARAPVKKFFSLLRTNAEPFPGFCKGTSRRACAICCRGTSKGVDVGTGLQPARMMIECGAGRSASTS
eukprot:365125-Chlamydomonas_euryale.AAC.4